MGLCKRVPRNDHPGRSAAVHDTPFEPGLARGKRTAAGASRTRPAWFPSASEPGTIPFMGKALAVRDWLWQLDRIEDALAGLDPDRSIFAAFSIWFARPRPRAEDLGFRQCFWSTWRDLPVHRDRSGRVRWFAPAACCGAPAVWVENDGWRLSDPRPKKVREWGFWGTWFFRKADLAVSTNGGYADRFWHGWGAIEDAIQVCLDSAPKPVRAVAKEIRCHCWATSLFLLAVKGVTNPLGAFDTLSPGGKRSEHRLIFLNPDLPTATKHAFDAFRWLARRGPCQEETGTGTTTTDVPLDAEDVKILEALADSGEHLQSLYDLETRTKMTRKTIGPRVNRFIEKGLACRPKGKNGGVMLTEEGRKRCPKSTR